MPTSCGTPVVRVGIDIGGTFTDIAVEVDGVMHSAKVLTDRERPERGVIEGLRTAVDRAGVALGAIRQLIHGTTLATNALIERRGAKTGFVTTRGFRDVLEMRTESRFEQYDLNIQLPPPLIARADRLTLTERIDAQGRVLLAPEEAEIEALCVRLAERGYESVAIGFIHSYVNDVHERRMRDALAARLPSVELSISSEVSPQMREYERFNTVCANAYVKPLMKTYLERLVVELASIGVGCPLFLMHSGGGIIAVESAAGFPVRLVESGPAGGAVFAADIARRYGLERVLSYDMGGTTAKICLIDEGSPKTARTFEVARTWRFKKGSGMPISIPVVEMVEIGAGGGSIAAVDAMRRIRVGPQSAGSEPGPACYGLGGDAPTVTDADLLLGRIDPDDFAGGRMRLDADAARAALARHVAGPLSLDGEAAAYGVCEMVDENMANAGRVHAVENGKDPGEYTMICFGGAGPLHAARLCAKMGIDRFLVPKGAGVGSAIGFLRAPFAFEAVRSRLTRLDAFDAEAVNELLESMREEAAAFVAAGAGEGERAVSCIAHMRYAGQGWEIPVAIDPGGFGAGDEGRIAEAFAEAYTRFFGRPVEGLAIEIVGFALKVASIVPPPSRIRLDAEGANVPARGRRRLFDPAQGRFVDAAVHERDALRAGDAVVGPAVLVESETATVVGSGFRAVVQADGSVLVGREAGMGERR
ncbi:MAG: hydantoinase/oxoprolinase family protein [Geminicoccaceae bacterium]|nr:hydantoinase/oxoprolinase family protein [Geminicoccaceae bacterium]